MAFTVTNQDCSTLTEIELESLAEPLDLADGPAAAVLSKERDHWVTAFLVRDKTKFAGFAFATLERIGGTPTVVVGFASVATGGAKALKALSDAIRKKARVAFPDEDVIFTLRLKSTPGLGFLDKMVDCQPSSVEKPGGEERAWGRRLAKRFEATEFNDKTMVAALTDDVRVIELDAPEVAESDIRLSTKKKSYTIVWGWALVELLEQY